MATFSSSPERSISTLWSEILSEASSSSIQGTVEDTVDFEGYRVSVGFGIRLNIPALGPAPLAFDFGFPILKQEDDNKQLFSFSMAVPF